MKKLLLSIIVLLATIASSIGQLNDFDPRANLKSTLIPNDCRCDRNLITNGNFSNVLTDPGSSNISNSSTTWKPIFSSPQWTRTDGYCDSGMVIFWGHKTNGEAISQNVNIIQGRKYTIKLCVRLQPGSAQPYVRLRVFAFNGAYTYNNTSPTQVLIGQTANITSTSFATVTITTCWEAPANYSNIAINPENDLSGGPSTVSWAAIDNFCIQEAVCDCGNWAPTVISNDKIKKSVNCGQSIVVLKGKSYTINPSFSCTCGCRATFLATLTSPSGQTQSITSFPYTFIPTQLCNYRLTITALCGEKRCSSCVIDLFSTPGCEGDIIIPRRYETFEYIDFLFTGDFKKKSGNFLQLDINSKAAILNGFSAGSYLFQLNKKEISVVNAQTGRLLTSYPYQLYVPSPAKTCEEQEKEQWKKFNEEVAPGLLARANATCSRAGYCLTILCNGDPVKFYLLYADPTNKMCLTFKEYALAAFIKSMKVMEVE